MARLVRHEATGPHRVDPQDKPVFICACGLTRNAPFCDGKHAECRSEEPGTLYVYDESGRRIVNDAPDSDAEA